MNPPPIPPTNFPTLHRRSFCAGLACLLAACSTPTLRTPSGEATNPPLPPVGNTLSKSGITSEQLLNRLTWGNNFSATLQVQAIGMDRYLDQQLRGRYAILPTAVQAQINAMSISQQAFEPMMRELEVRRMTAEQQKGVDDRLRKEYQQELNRLAKEAASRSLLRNIYSPNQLQEQMTWFWMNHFNLHSGKHNVRAMLGDFEEHAIRPHALGNFRDLLRATVMHPAMLRYLDNEHNAVNHINENYARELMELHTMGVNSGYTQTDVQELARVLTGLGVNQNSDTPKLKPGLEKLYVRQGLTEFHPHRHDFGEKHLLGIKIQGKGLSEVDEVIRLLCKQPATARYISHKLAIFWVSDTPSEALVTAMADSFLRSDGNIPLTLRTMFDSPEFTASLGKKFKDPIHYMLSAIRLAYDGSVIVNTAPMLNWLNMMGETLNGRQTPDGYSMTESAWASPGQMAVRFDLAKTMSGGSPGLFKGDTPVKDKPPLPALASSHYVNQWSKQFSPGTQDILKQAASAQEWNALFLASPEMMRR